MAVFKLCVVDVTISAVGSYTLYISIEYWCYLRLRVHLLCSDRLAAVRDLVFHKVGEDWIFLTILGVLMAFLSFGMDYIIEKCQEGRQQLFI